MDSYIFAYLFDIKTSIEEIESYFPNGKVFQFYHEDLKTKRAVERNIEIIGEASKKISKELKEKVEAEKHKRSRSQCV